METQKALEILNSMSIVDVDSDGEAMIYIYVEDSAVNREKLMSLGYTFIDIQNGTYEHDEHERVIDLNYFVWNFASWFNGEIFLDYVPGE